ncbi:IS200/IS605 family transposase [Bacillus sp. FJAT-42315]|uniref:IS200/IS605 family transposase n=1 Tax=Bacillus sp. FJAT-42315 TaxID=2014077 RepID=UPI000C2336EC|nr:IS200/IS605 family transposase [Bacillus sp. FJAT-42315]
MPKEDAYTHKKGIVYKNQFHIIFTPKYRRPVLVNGVDEKLKEILFEIAEEKEITIKGLEIMSDHVHIFIDFDPRLMLHKIIKDFKGRSSRILREEFPWLKSRLPSLWTRNYFSCSVGHVNEETIRKYIENQKNA